MNPWTVRALYLAAGMAIGAWLTGAVTRSCCRRHQARLHALLDRVTPYLDEEGDW